MVTPVKKKTKKAKKGLNSTAESAAATSSSTTAATPSSNSDFNAFLQFKKLKASGVDLTAEDFAAFMQFQEMAGSLPKSGKKKGDRKRPPVAQATTTSDDPEPRQIAEKEYNETVEYMKNTESTYDLSDPEKHPFILNAIKKGYSNLLQRNGISLDYTDRHYNGDMKSDMEQITKDPRIRKALTYQVDICLFIAEVHYVLGVNAWPLDERNIGTRQIYNLMCYYVNARKERGETSQGHSDVNCTIDTEYINYVLDRTEHPIHFQHMLPHFMFARNLMVKCRNDIMSDLEGVLILVSLAFMNVSDIKGSADVELIPFLKALRDGLFQGGLHKLSILLFGMALNPCVAETTFAKSCGKNTMSFINATLKKGRNNVNKIAARTLQFMCINWLFQQMLLSFDNNIEKLEAKAKSDDKYKDYVTALLFVKDKVLPLFTPVVSNYNGIPGNNFFQTTKAQRIVQDLVHYDFMAKSIIFLSKSATKRIEYKETGEFDISSQASIFHLENRESKLKAEHTALFSVIGSLRHVTENLVDHQFPTEEAKSKMPESLKRSYSLLCAQPSVESGKPIQFPKLTSKPWVTKTAKKKRKIAAVAHKNAKPPPESYAITKKAAKALLLSTVAIKQTATAPQETKAVPKKTEKAPINSSKPEKATLADVSISFEPAAKKDLEDTKTNSPQKKESPSTESDDDDTNKKAADDSTLHTADLSETPSKDHRLPKKVLQINEAQAVGPEEDRKLSPVEDNSSAAAEQSSESDSDDVEEILTKPKAAPGPFESTDDEKDEYSESEEEEEDDNEEGEKEDSEEEEDDDDDNDDDDE